MKEFELNDVDITALVAPGGYIVSTKVVQGGNKMTMADGRTYMDIVANLSCVKVPFMPLTDDQLAVLTKNLFSGGVAKIKFYEPIVEPGTSTTTGYYHTMQANYKLSNRKYRGLGADGNYYWTGVTIDFEEFGTGYHPEVSE